MRDQTVVWVFRVAILVLLVLTAATIRWNRRRGRRLELVDYSGQLGGVFVVLPDALKLPPVLAIPSRVVGVAFFLYTAWGHHRRAFPRPTSPEDPRVDVPPPGR